MPKKESFERLVEDVGMLVNNPSIREVVKEKVKEFQEMQNKDYRFWFEELAFCILTANSSAEMGLKCIKALKKRRLIFNGSKHALEKALQELGHRYPSKRAEYIFLARSRSKELKENLLRTNSTIEAREWLVKEIKGIGWKEGSHFLRNIGFLDRAIIDRHVFRIMFEYDLIKKINKSLTKKRYLEYEKTLRDVSLKLDLPLGELDLYLWYMKTGKIIK